MLSVYSYNNFLHFIYWCLVSKGRTPHACALPLGYRGHWLLGCAFHLDNYDVYISAKHASIYGMTKKLGERKIVVNKIM